MIVSINGRPAATSEPKASSMIARVTGQEINSDLIIASLLALLKSDHMPEAPVSEAVTVSSPTAAISSFRSSAARTIWFESDAAPAWTTRVPPSGEVHIGSTATRVTSSLAARVERTSPTLASKAGSPAFSPF